MRFGRKASAGRLFIAIAAAIVFPLIIGSKAAAQVPIYGEEFVNYFSNAHTASDNSANVFITDPLEFRAGTPPAGQPLEICAMLYVFDTTQEMEECCGCPLTSDALLVLNVTGSLTANPVSLPFSADSEEGLPGTGRPPFFFDGVLRLLSAQSNASTTPSFRAPSTSQLRPGVWCDRTTGKCCDPTKTPLTLIPTLRAWADHTQLKPITESAFADLPLGATAE